MKAKEIQELIDFIAKSGLEEVNIETEQFKLKVKRNSPTQYKFPEPIPQPVISVAAPAPLATVPQPQIIQAPVTPAAPATAATPSAENQSRYITIKSPMIGTFYRSSNPDSPVFVNIGDDVKKGQTVCIIEAMKLFNEIESEISGKVIKVLVENSSPVEYDQPLFLIDPS
jgi:acetyl-CoA carboxylase biotin carboxyl carrier protein